MAQPPRSDFSPPRATSRAQSYTSDRNAMSTRSNIACPPVVKPEPLYLSPAAASQWVSAELDDDDLSVAEPPLGLLNAFLDQVLYQILSSSRSTRLPQLRKAVPEVLQQRLAREAIRNADEELREYDIDGDDEELFDFYDGQEPPRSFDLDHAWKLARLRCMVYTRLGDLEEDDALEIIERDQLDESGGPRHFLSGSSTVTPAAAIFLTSVLEYLGEQALYHAGILAQKRLSKLQAQVQEESTQPPGSTNRVADSHSVEEIDMLRLGREGPLMRIWRSWRSNIRSPRAENFTRPFSPDRLDEPDRAQDGHSRSGSAVTPMTTPHKTIAEAIEERDPAQVPLPISDNDVNEIEVPGLAREIGDDEDVHSTAEPVAEKAKRPTSMISPENPTPAWGPRSSDKEAIVPDRSAERPRYSRTRSHSLPSGSPTALRLAEIKSLHNQTNAHVASPYIQEGDQIGTDDVPLPSETSQSPKSDRASKRRGMLIDSVPAVDRAATQSPANLRSGQGQSMSANETIADKILQTHPTLNSKRNSVSAVTEASIHDVTDFEHMHVPQERPDSKGQLLSRDTRSGERDPEDLALSSDEEPKIAEREEKHDSVPPLQGYSYSSKPSNSIVPAPVHSESQRAPIHGAVSSPSQHEADTAPMRPSDAPIAATSASAAVAAAAAAISNYTRGAPKQAQPALVPQDKILPSSTASTTIRTPASQGRHSNNAESVSSEYSSSSADRSSSSSKLLGFTRDEQGRPQTSDTERAAPPSTARAVNGTRPSRANSKAAAAMERPGTSGSQQSSRKPPLRLRTSSDDLVDPAGDFDSEERKRSLEVLIKSDETLHYTLTPKSARGAEVTYHVTSNGRELLTSRQSPQSARFPPPVKRSSVDRSRRNSGQRSQHTAQKSVSSVTTTNGLRSHPTTDEDRAPSSYVPMASTAAAAVAAGPSRPATERSNARKDRPYFGEPREAKVQQVSHRDLADYLRSTGPENEKQLPQQLPKDLASRPSTAATVKAQPPVTEPSPPVPQSPMTPTQSSAPQRSTAALPPNIVATSASKSATSTPSKNPALPRQQPASEGRTGTPSSSKSAYVKKVPRDATVSRTDQSGPLIDFIREGPPRQAGDHRIPRSVAPFRRTMDSDDLNGLAPGGVDGNSATSTQNSSVARSMQSTVNSQTPLLNGGQANGVKSAVSLGKKPQAVDPMPPRKQRRVRDPYAIDDSDDEVEEVATPKPKRDEESLIDFLRNTAPPPTKATPPPVMMSASSSASQNQKLQKKESNSGIKDRLVRNASSFTKKNSSNNMDPPAYTKGNTARPDSPHLSQQGSKVDSYKPTQPTHASHVDRNRHPRGDAGDMDPVTKDESGFLAFFARRKSVKK